MISSEFGAFRVFVMSRGFSASLQKIMRFRRVISNVFMSQGLSGESCFGLCDVGAM